MLAHQRQRNAPPQTAEKRGSQQQAERQTGINVQQVAILDVQPAANSRDLDQYYSNHPYQHDLTVELGPDSGAEYRHGEQIDDRCVTRDRDRL